QGWTQNNNEFIKIYDDVLFIGLTTDRENLYKRINDRFDKMLVPLIDEVKPYALKNIRSKSLMTGIGYKEFYPFFNNEDTLVNVVEECKKNSRNYAKRQYTWFNNQMDVKWFDVNFEDFNKTIEQVCLYVEDNMNN
nr:tRNA (adenosine(37)-N6)-dimethylallyltransferase MiaA [Bacilli bacterium]